MATSPVQAIRHIVSCAGWDRKRKDYWNEICCFKKVDYIAV